MGFAWHKLIPRPIEDTLACLDYCCCSGPCTALLCPDITWDAVYDDQGNFICYGNQPSSAPNACCVRSIPYFHCFWRWSVEEGRFISFCEELSIVVYCNCLGNQTLIDDPNGPDRSFDGGPMTMRIFLGAASGSSFGCRRVNGQNYGQKTSCDPNQSTDEFPLRYYNTPLQAAGLTAFGYTRLCNRIITYAVPDRTMIFSGRNKYRYSGFLTPDGSTFNCGIPTIIDNPGASGLSQMEGSLSRQFPSSDDVLGSPLWGARIATGPGPGEGDDPTCYPTVCFGSGCYGVVENDGTGHYLPATTISQGYYSFSCFNPHAIWKGYNETVGLPTCSLYSMVWALYNAAWREYGVPLSGDIYESESDFLGAGGSIASTFTTLRNRLTTLLSTDPSGTVGGVSNVQLQLESFEDGLQSFVESFDAGIDHRIFTAPQVFLWDRTSYIAANAANKWKHLYIAGSANILMDTGCTATGPYPTGWAGFRCVLDEVTHDMTWGSTHAAQLIGFMGCNNELNSIQKVVMEDLGCAIGGSEEQYTDAFCSLCATNGSPYNMDPEVDCVPHPMNPSLVYTDLLDPYCTCCT